jgi:hypothetical protein
MRRIAAEVHALGVAGFPGGSQPGRVESACRARRRAWMLRSRGGAWRGGLARVTGPGGSRVTHCDQCDDRFRHRLNTDHGAATETWVLGAAHDTVDWEAQNECQVQIQADGPFGPIEPVEFVIIKGSRAAPLRTTSSSVFLHTSPSLARSHYWDGHLLTTRSPRTCHLRRIGRSIPIKRHR